MELAIHDRGRGPEIKGSRITVYDVLAESQAGATPEEMAGWWQLEVAQIHLALKYIEDHKEEVMREWAKIKARHARGNPPELQKKLDEMHARMAPVYVLMRAGEREKAIQLFMDMRRRSQQGQSGDVRIANEPEAAVADEFIVVDTPGA